VDAQVPKSLNLYNTPNDFFWQRIPFIASFHESVFQLPVVLLHHCKNWTASKSLVKILAHNKFVTVGQNGVTLT